MSLYRTVLHEGQRDDLTTYLNYSLLVTQWPVLRTLISPAIPRAWEAAFPELAASSPPSMGALADRGVARDLIDVHAASNWRPTAELENRQKM